jgi:hypothetical protein
MTAVEYIEAIIYGDKEFSLSEAFEQAKEMEKQQIMKAVFDSMGTNLDPNMGEQNSIIMKPLNQNKMRNLIFIFIINLLYKGID